MAAIGGLAKTRPLFRALPPLLLRHSAGLTAVLVVVCSATLLCFGMVAKQSLTATGHVAPSALVTELSYWAQAEPLLNVGACSLWARNVCVGLSCADSSSSHPV